MVKKKYILKKKKLKYEKQQIFGQFNVMDKAVKINLFTKNIQINV